MSYESANFLVTLDGPVLDISINRPEVRNALTWAMDDELDKLFAVAADDDRVRVVTLRGEGKMFCAGHDLKAVAEGMLTVGHPLGYDPHRVPQLRGMWYFPKPIIAAVHEYVGPIAQDILAYCDFVIASEGTRFSFEQSRNNGGLVYWSPLVFQLPMRVWKKLSMTGGWYTAEQALKWDFVQRVVPLERLRAESRAWADEIALVPPEQLRAARLGIHRQYELMGLANMALVQDNYSGHGSEIDREFFRIVLERGVAEAVRFRQAESDAKITQV